MKYFIYDIKLIRLCGKKYLIKHLNNHLENLFKILVINIK